MGRVSGIVFRVTWGCLLGAFGELFGICWGALGASGNFWEPVGSFGELLGSLWGALGSFGELLGSFVDTLGSFWEVFA